jgi:hypothetical protein
MKLRPDQKIILTQSIGYPKKQKELAVGLSGGNLRVKDANGSTLGLRLT